MSPRTMHPLLTLLLVCGCTQHEATESKRTAELAEKLVTCENERNDLRDKLQVSLAQQARNQAQQDQQAAPAEKSGDRPAAAPTRQGRTLSHRLARPDRDMPSVHPTVRGTGDDENYRGPDNPAGEAHEAQAVAQTIKTNFSQFKPCYERGLKRNSNLQFVTQVKVRLTISSQGRPKEVHTTPRTDSDMEQCMAQVMSRWPLPPYKGKPVLIEVPVGLKVQGQ